MAEHSKIAAATKENLVQIIIEALTGSPQKKAFSGLLLAIIGYLLYIKNKKSTTDNIKIKEPSKKSVRKHLFREEEKDMSTLSSLKELNNL